MSCLKRVVTAVCAALFLAVQTAFPVFARDRDVMLVLCDIFDAASHGAEEFYDSLEYGSADRIAYSYTELYGSVGAEGYIASIKLAAQELMASERFVKPTDIQKCAIALAHYGECTQELINAAVYLNEDFDKQGLNAYIWGLIAVRRTDLAPPDNAINTQQSLTEHLLSKQLADGGFALTGSKADCDITAAVIYALAQQREDAAVGQAIDRAFGAIKAMQLESGGFASMGTENCESTAQAIIAAASLGEREWIEKSGALDALLMYRCEGGFSHLIGREMNALSVSQACTALTAYVKLLGQEEISDTVPETEQSAQVLQTAEAADTVEASAPKLTGGGIRMMIVAACAVIGFVLGAVWLLGGRKKPVLLIAAVVCLAAGVAAAFAEFSFPEEYYAQSAVSQGITVTVSGDCLEALRHTDKADEGVVFPADGTVLAECEVTLPTNATALDALAQAARLQRVTIDYIDSWSGVYVRGIAGLYEFDFGSESGWLYYVNGVSPSCAMSEYTLSNGDKVEMIYTCTLGRQD